MTPAQSVRGISALRGRKRPPSSTENADVEPLSPGEYVEAARNPLKIAEALDYGNEQDFEELQENLDELDAKIDAAHDTGGIFDKIGDSFIRLKQRLFGSDSE